MNSQDVIHYVAMAAVFLLEYWLGQTKSVEANSTIQLIINVVKLLATKTKE